MKSLAILAILCLVTPVMAATRSRADDTWDRATMKLDLLRATPTQKCLDAGPACVSTREAKDGRTYLVQILVEMKGATPRRIVCLGNPAHTRRVCTELETDRPLTMDFSPSEGWVFGD